MKSPRVGVIGPRRTRQGLGPFVIRDLRSAGAEVPCVLGRGEDSVAAARKDLREKLGIDVRGYVDLPDMAAKERLDAVAILSPSRTHRAYLEQALECGVHVLCEKPLVWGEADPAAVAGRIVSGFREKGLLLRENCQWPYTLPAFERLHPGTLAEGARSFRMRMSPVSTGAEMLADTMPHIFSLLQSLAPADRATLERAEFSTHDPESEEMTVRFHYRTDPIVECEIRLAPSPALPREAGYGVNGKWAERAIRKEDYAIFFTAESRRVDVEDPMRLLLSDFVQDLRGPDPGGNEARLRQIALRMELLDRIIRSFREGRP